MSLFVKKTERALSFQQVWGVGDSKSLLANSLEGALRVVPVYAATALIADQIAASPWTVFQKTGGIPKKLPTPPQLFTDPGVGLDLFGWKHQLCTSVLLRGNSYGLITEIDSHGIPAKVSWLRPDEVSVDERGPVPIFTYNNRTIPRDSLIHIPGYMLPGSVVGLSPVSLFRLQVETGMKAQEYGERFFDRGAIPSGHLKNTSKTLSAADADGVKTRFVANVSSQKPFVSGNDWEYTPLTASVGDVKFLDAIKATANQIAAAYRVSPEDVGGETGGSSMTYKNLEQDQIRFAVRTLQPWTARIEAAFNAFLPANQYVKFNLDAAARADLLTRYQAHDIAIKAGFESIDEVRSLEERAPLTAQEKADYLELSRVHASISKGV